jgi:hypothetical protein
MFQWLPIPLQVYLFSLLIGVALPLFLFWMMRRALTHFLSAIFVEAAIVRFWQLLIAMVLVLTGLAAAVRYRASEDVLQDDVAIIFSVSDALQAILENMLFTLFALFVPLLVAYMVVNAGRDRSGGRGFRRAVDQSESPDAPSQTGPPPPSDAP